ncbi:hypothetical protein K8R30_04040 [archaeon]|nr:hypothetical protein [archaeon]
MKQVVINLSDKLYFTLLAAVFVCLLGIGVYAYGTSDPVMFGHSSEEIESINWSQISGIPIDIADGDNDSALGTDCYWTGIAKCYGYPTCPSGYYVAGVGTSYDRANCAGMFGVALYCCR